MRRTEAYEKVKHLFGTTAKSKQPTNLLVSSQKDESFEKWKGNFQ